MTAYPGTIVTPTARSGRASPMTQPTLRRLAGRVGTAFTALREAIAATQLGPLPEQTATRWAGARA
jgi:hypothetical protein